MSNGDGKAIVVNNLERAVSSDINRLQSFIGLNAAEVWRALLDSSSGTWDVDAGSLYTQYTTQETPLRAEIFGGLLVKPQSGSLNLLVDPGVLFCLDPDSPQGTDDSPYKLIRDPGITLAGALAITGNASGSTRIDVIECARVAAPGYTITETDSRDIYNPVTGLFTATTVPKVTEGRLQYRVRAGTPGAGFPGTAAGWLPLAVVSVPTGSTNVDTMCFWDVRPLLNDRVFNLSNMGQDLASGLHLNLSCASYTATTDITVQGHIAINYNGRRLGGKLRRGTPGSDATAGLVIGSTITDNLAGSFTGFTADGLWYFYLLTPFGLPRWARYTDGPGTRQPRSPCGIPVISMTPPDADGKISAAINLPTSTGLLGNTTSGVCVFASSCPAIGQPGCFIAQGRRVMPVNGIAIGAAGSLANVRYTLVPGSHFPPNAKRVQLQATAIVNATGMWQWSNTMKSYNDAAATAVLYLHQEGLFQADGAVDFILNSDWFPVPPVYPATTAPSFAIDHEIAATGFATYTTSAGVVYGYEF